MASAVNLKTVANLPHENLIHLEEPVRERPGWADYFSYWKVPYSEPKTGLRLNDYALVLQAAIAGEGFAFGSALALVTCALCLHHGQLPPTHGQVSAAVPLEARHALVVSTTARGGAVLALLRAV